MEKKTTKDAIRSTYEIFSSVKWEYKRLNEKKCKIRGLFFSNEGAKGRTPLFDVSKSQTGGIMAYWENESKGWVCISAPEPGYEIKAPIDMSGMFAGFDDLIYLDVTHLDVSQTWYFTSCFEGFGRQKGSEIIGLNTWDISSGMDFKKMFSKDVFVELAKSIVKVIGVIYIAYNEIAEIAAYTKDGKRIPIIENGRFVLPGAELLNEALDK